MRTPRDVTGKELIKKLRRFGYEESRQVGSHVRLTTKLNGTHHITIPLHRPIKIGTLSSILADIGGHLVMSKDELMKELF